MGYRPYIDPVKVYGPPPNQRSGGRMTVYEAFVYGGVSPAIPRIPPKPVQCRGCGAWGTSTCDYCGNPLPHTYDVPSKK